MKKILSLLLLCSFVLLSLTACMSDEEKQQARENERLAKPAIERYIKQNYNGASIKKVECLTHTGGSVFPETYATDFVRAKVSYKLKTFDVVMDLETNEFYNNYYNQKIEKELKNLLYGTLSVDKPKDIELKFIDRTVLSNISSGWGYLKADIDSAEDLLTSNEHKVYVVCKYADSNMDFETIPVKRFFKSDYKSDIELFFINYKNAERYNGCDEISAGYSRTAFLNNPGEIYSIEEIKSASKLYAGNSYEEIDDVTDVQEYEEDYVHNKSQIVNNVEFVWNDLHYDIDFSQTKAEPVVTTDYYSGEPFYAKSRKALKLNCKKRADAETDYRDQVYMFFDNSLSGKYLITKNNGNVEVDSLSWTLNNKCLYQYVNLRDNSHEITLGIYERKNEDNY